MKQESLVIANQHVAVNMYLDLAQTARHVSEVGLRKENKVIYFILFFNLKTYFRVFYWWRRRSRNMVAVEESVAGEFFFLFLFLCSFLNLSGISQSDNPLFFILIRSLFVITAFVVFGLVHFLLKVKK